MRNSLSPTKGKHGRGRTGSGLPKDYSIPACMHSATKNLIGSAYSWCPLSPLADFFLFYFLKAVQLSLVLLLAVFPDKFQGIVSVNIFLNVSFLMCVIIVLRIFFQRSANVFNICFTLKKFITDVFPGFKLCNRKKGTTVFPSQ